MKEKTVVMEHGQCRQCDGPLCGPVRQRILTGHPYLICNTCGHQTAVERLTCNPFKCPCGTTVNLWFSERLGRHACPECWNDGRVALATDESGEKVVGKVCSYAVGSKTWWIATVNDGKQGYEAHFADLKGAVERMEVWSRRIPGVRIWKEVP